MQHCLSFKLTQEHTHVIDNCSFYVTIFCNQFNQTQSAGTKLQCTATLIHSLTLLMLLQYTDRIEIQYKSCGIIEVHGQHDIRFSYMLSSSFYCKSCYQFKEFVLTSKKRVLREKSILFSLSRYYPPFMGTQITFRAYKNHHLVPVLNQRIPQITSHLIASKAF